MDHWDDQKKETAKGTRHRLDKVEMEPCPQHHVSRGGLPVSAFSNGPRRRPLARERRYPFLLAVGVILGMCCWVDFRLGKRSTFIWPNGALVEVDQAFVEELQRAYDKHHEPTCASKSSSRSKSGKGRHCGTGGDSTILSLQCQNGARPTAGNWIHQSLSAYNPTLVCAQNAVSSPSLSLQTILEQKYDLVLVESHSGSSKGEAIYDNLDFWKTMLQPRGIVARFCCSALVHNESPQDQTKPLPPTSTSLIPWSSPQQQDEFLSRVTTMYKAKICSPFNKQGLFCRGNILSLDCNHRLGLQLLQEYMPGRGIMYCPQNTQASSSSSDSPRKLQKQVPLEELFQRRYEAIILDPSNNYPSNLELWSQLLVPGGLILIFGTSTENPIPSNEYLKSLELEAYYKSPTPPYFLIFANSQGFIVNVTYTNKAREDETAVLKNFQPNQGKVDTQIQLSPVSFEDRYPTIYRSVSNELLQSHTSSSTSCSKVRADSSTSCEPIKVLSFGCSYGFEMKSLADKYLSEKADIYGVDVNDPVVAQAQENVKVVESNKMIVLDGKTDPASNYGPFDAVFANSVLCYNRFPEPKDVVDKIKSMFTFDTFVGLLHQIDVLVKVGGFLSLDNTNYLFNETSLFRDKYQTYREHEEPLCRQDVWLMEKNGTVIFNPHTDNRTAFTVYCIFVKVKE